MAGEQGSHEPVAWWTIGASKETAGQHDHSELFQGRSVCVIFVSSLTHFTLLTVLSHHHSAQMKSVMSLQSARACSLGKPHSQAVIDAVWLAPLELALTAHRHTIIKTDVND